VGLKHANYDAALRSFVGQNRTKVGLKHAVLESYIALAQGQNRTKVGLKRFRHMPTTILHSGKIEPRWD